jgi:hypothetical protein
MRYHQEASGTVMHGRTSGVKDAEGACERSDVLVAAARVYLRCHNVR